MRGEQKVGVGQADRRGVEFLVVQWRKGPSTKASGTGLGHRWGVSSPVVSTH